MTNKQKLETLKQNREKISSLEEENVLLEKELVEKFANTLKEKTTYIFKGVNFLIDFDSNWAPDYARKLPIGEGIRIKLQDTRDDEIYNAYTISMENFCSGNFDREDLLSDNERRDINSIKKKEKEERAEYKRLKEKYGN